MPLGMQRNGMYALSKGALKHRAISRRCGTTGHPGYARRFWEGWYERAMSSGIGPLCQFARRIKPYLPGILAHTRWPLWTNLFERHQQPDQGDQAHSPMASAMTTTSSSRSGQPSPEIGEDGMNAPRPEP